MNIKYRIHFRFRPFVAFLLSGLAAIAQAQETAPPRIGLVLGGGGARGAAHVGVLKKLQELRIPVDCVAGTSMGGLVAGAFSSGLSAADMQAALQQADWRDMFSDAASYADFTPRMKGLSQAYIPGTEGGLKNGALQFPSAVLSGQKIIAGRHPVATQPHLRCRLSPHSGFPWHRRSSAADTQSRP